MKKNNKMYYLNNDKSKILIPNLPNEKEVVKILVGNNDENIQYSHVCKNKESLIKLLHESINEDKLIFIVFKELSLFNEPAEELVNLLQNNKQHIYFEAFISDYNSYSINPFLDELADEIFVEDRLDFEDFKKIASNLGITILHDEFDDNTYDEILESKVSENFYQIENLKKNLNEKINQAMK